ncbi:MAG: zinc ABC transporter substrate-binding protein [Candidatus Marinimicrobia bacterium]|jgi:ABC-type Zn uptake system ZnuABC Zn-binding protein ZnuA|nr:zinc ABC transporter substrate-binding protein [Candidatus Neomarinimicrobiota bacterium]MBT3576398.1 zinc ABC transporter substrate-binding protein [Candidatus Neomarinimicrobiota bacterium]MBT3680096.1 zinc ABC transporter substrate-binding protein [Candidatus Neomarinimicrobiota bacterium]MBT3950081.1 zinc ABC transporter substrate-binding protein [Candidatus Neomarinimicrobiota bacterium]MBT4254380.1 zinc ABC transporter substrate-binding protein [Candidatus Neomarinimicrobiota bacterium
MLYRIILVLALSLSLQAKISVVASTSDLADIAGQIGGKHVTTLSIARGSQDPHYVEVLPSYMIKVKRADMYLMVGMELDQWAEQIIDGSRNSDLRIVDCSADITPLEVPTRKVDASMGDIHPNGNPHYWLDPDNGKAIARTIAVHLKQIDPEHGETYDQNLLTFIESLTTLEKEWVERFSDLRGKRLIYYHNTWPYFNRYFGLEAVAFVEPNPGIMPTPTHLDHLIHLIQEQNIQVIAMEPYFSDKAPNYLTRKTGIVVVGLAQSVDARKGTETYQRMLTYNLEILQKAFTP